MTPDASSWLRVAEMCIDMADAWPEMCRLAGIAPGPDGYGRGGGGSRGGGVADPTARVAESVAGGKDRESGDDDTTPDTWTVPSERVGQLVEHLMSQSRAMHDNARRVASLKRLIEGRADDRVGRQSSLVDCLACEAGVSGIAADRIKTGYCPRCWTAWVRYRMSENQAGRAADHELFRRRQRRVIEKARAS